ncbi:metallophosphoesterase [Anaerotignum sp.]
MKSFEKDLKEGKMIYCVSDIHGEYDRFKKLLELICFSENDQLYIIGDVIDRYSDGVKLLLDIMDNSNMHMIIGNHEQMLLDTLGPNNKIDARKLWKQNGGDVTYRELVYQRQPEERRKIIEFLEKLPDYIDITVNEQPFHLVHGYPSEDRDVRLWGRPKSGMKIPMEEVTVIVGHTPTIYLNDDCADDGEPFRIWYGEGIICIDCGCGHEMKERRLACLRLDDMKEFYV